jgi:hypothetical protein
VPVGEEAAQAEGGERAPVEVDVAPQVGLGDARLVEGTQGAPRALGAEREGRRGVRGAYAMPLAVGLHEVEGGGAGAGDMRAKQRTVYGMRVEASIAPTLDKCRQGVKVVDPPSRGALLS